MSLLPISAISQLSGGHGLLGHSGEIERNRLVFIEKVTRETARLSRLRVPTVNAVVINHPDLLHEVMVERARDYDKSHLLRYSLYLLAGNGLFTALFDTWKRNRRMIAPAFHPGSLGVFAEPMVDCAQRVTAEWHDRSQIDLLRETTRITMAIAGRTLFDADTLLESDDIGHALTVALEWAGNNAPSARAFVHLLVRHFTQVAADATNAPAESRRRGLQRTLTGPVLLVGKEGRELKHAIAVLDKHVERIVAARRSDPKEHGDLLARLLAAKDEVDGSSLDAKQLRDEILTLFVAGHETTATALAWCIDLLAHNPDEYALVQREVDALSGPPTAADLPQLPATLRAFKEALRLYPPVYLFSRQASRDTELAGYAIPKHTAVAISPLAMHRRPDFWPEPDTFRPARFLPEAERSRPKLAWLPFGAGPRVCIGAQFALMEGQLVLAHLLRAYEFSPLGTSRPDPSATLRPAGGMPMRIRKRA
jgi:cytochrome P450